MGKRTHRRRTDIEAERRRDLVRVLAVELLHHGRLPCVVEPEDQEPNLNVRDGAVTVLNGPVSDL